MATGTTLTTEHKLTKYLDFNHDGKLDAADIPAFFVHIFDFNHDGKLNISDLSALITDINNATARFDTLVTLIEAQCGVFLASPGFLLLPTQLQVSINSLYDVLKVALTLLVAGSTVTTAIGNDIVASLTALDTTINNTKSATIPATTIVDTTKAVVTLIESSKKLATLTNSATVVKNVNSINKRLATLYKKLA